MTISALRILLCKWAFLWRFCVCFMAINWWGELPRRHLLKHSALSSGYGRLPQ